MNIQKTTGQEFKQGDHIKLCAEYNGHNKNSKGEILRIYLNGSVAIHLTQDNHGMEINNYVLLMETKKLGLIEKSMERKYPEDLIKI